MATLYKTATPLQKRMLKIIEGAVINTYHAHKEKPISPERFARSVAKRAVGTLTAQMQDVLAGSSAPSDQAG